MSMLPHERQIAEYEKALEQLKSQASPLLSQQEVESLESKLTQLKQKVYAELTPWERVAICRHPARPRTVDYIKALCEEFTELHGDRLFADDSSIVAGFAKIGGVRCMVVGHEKGNDTETRLQRNFGMPHPEGYRKAMRCMRLAAKFHLPVICFVDTPGAYHGLAAEERGQGWAIAQNLWEMSALPTPILVLLIGEGCSGGALGIGIGDIVGMLEHSYYSVISPEACSSILFKDATKNAEAAKILKMHAEDLLSLGVIDAILKEPMGGAHHDKAVVYETVRSFLLDSWAKLEDLSTEQLLTRRYEKFRSLGVWTTATQESVAATS